MTDAENTETVKIDIRIFIDQHDPEADTGKTVAEWNALTDRERSAIYKDMWFSMAECDDGGAKVVTPGAEEV